MDKLIPVILCGGKGSRLWPLSRKSFPKQYLNLEDDNPKTLIQNTYTRLKGINNLDYPIIICNQEHRFIVAEQIRAIEIKPKSILLEPFGRGTAPAAALSAIKATEKGEDPILLILSSDHIVKDKKKFQESIIKGMEYAKKGKLVTLGVVPEYAETGYGYIKTKTPAITNATALDIEKFIEKPNAIKAEEYFLNKCYSWNSGIFLFKASSIIKEIESFEPKIINCCRKSFEESTLDLDFQRIEKKSFQECPNISLDVAVMEKTKSGLMVSLNAGWKDIGSWNQVFANSKKDKNGNVLKGKVMTEDTNNCYVRSENRLVVSVGLKNLIIIETSDSVLVIDKNETQKVKKIVDKLMEKNFKEAHEHKTIFRPWGNYTCLVEDQYWQVKKIEVNPNQSLSLQMHNFRSEHWVIVKGKAKVELDGKISILRKNQSIYIPIKSKHRLTNPDSEILTLVEVQSGTQLAENDIVRFEDKYGRIEKE